MNSDKYKNTNTNNKKILMRHRFQLVPQAVSGGKQHPILHPMYSQRRSSHLVKPTQLLQSCNILKRYKGVLHDLSGIQCREHMPCKDSQCSYYYQLFLYQLVIMK